MSRKVCINYLVPVVATVDLDEGTVTRVDEYDENIVRVDDADGVATLLAFPVVDDAWTADAADLNTLTPEDFARALDIAENAEGGWPAWERG